MRYQTIAALMLLASTSAIAAPWEIRGAAPEVFIETNTMGPSLKYPGATGVWVTYSPSMSVDCSPPRACFAKTQRIYYLFNCSPRYAMPIERISADINGSIIKQETRSNADPYSADADTGAFVIMQAYCPLITSPDASSRQRSR